MVDDRVIRVMRAQLITKVVVQNQTGPKKNRYKPAIEDVK